MFTGCRMLASYTQAYRDLLSPSVKQPSATSAAHATVTVAAGLGRS
jgi:hypothetical protein